MSRDRKELSVGMTPEEAIGSFEKWDAEKHECIRDPQIGLWQVFHRRKTQDKTIRRPLSRETRKPFRHYQRPIVVTLLPGDLIAFRLKATKTKTIVEIEKLYGAALQWEAFTKANAKRAARAAKRKARRAK